MVDAEQGRGGIEHPRGVEGGDQRQVVAGRVGEPGDGAGHVGDRRRGDGGDHARGADGDDDVAGPRGQPERGGRVVAGARTQQRAGAGDRADLLGGPGDPGHGRAAPAHRPLQQVQAVPAGARRPVAGAAGVAPVGGERAERPVRGEPPGQPVVRQADRGGAVGVRRLGVSQPAQLGRGEGGDRHRADGVGPRPPPGRLVAVAELEHQVVRGPGRADVVPQQRVADHLAVVVQADHAVLLAADRHRGDVVEPAGGSGRRGERLLPGARGDLGAGRVRRAAGPDQLAGRGVADDDLAGLRRGVDAGDEDPRRRHRPNRARCELDRSMPSA